MVLVPYFVNQNSLFGTKEITHTIIKTAIRYITALSIPPGILSTLVLLYDWIISYIFIGIKPLMFAKAVKAYAADKNKNLANLIKYAKQLRVYKKVTDIMEVLLNGCLFN